MNATQEARLTELKNKITKTPAEEKELKTLVETKEAEVKKAE